MPWVMTLRNHHNLLKYVSLFMTPKQTERLQKKIADIKRILAAEKRKFGGYDDSRGLRYLPTSLYIKLEDYGGAFAYLKWFDKNFPDDNGFPEFLFEAAMILFKNSKQKEAEKKVFETFCANPYWLDKFFGNPIKKLGIWHCSNITAPEYTEALEYSSIQPGLTDFSDWLQKLLLTENFQNRCNKYISIYTRLNTETDQETRHYLVLQGSQLKNES